MQKALKNIYHDALLIDLTIGPRREIELQIRLDPVWNKKDAAVRIRFGNIKNFEDVRRYFEAIRSSRNNSGSLANIVKLGYEKEKPYPVGIDLSEYGYIIIEAGNVTES